MIQINFMPTLNNWSTLNLPVIMEVANEDLVCKRETRFRNNISSIRGPRLSEAVNVFSK
jgi:hypothetical protein